MKLFHTLIAFVVLTLPACPDRNSCSELANSFRAAFSARPYLELLI